MKVLMIVLGVGLFGILFLILISAFLPKKRSLTKTYEFRKPAREVWATIRDIEGQKNWRTDIRSIEMLSKNPERWRETNISGAITDFESVETLEEKHWKMKIISPSYIDGFWIGKLQTSDSGGTNVRFTENVSISNPIFRLLSYLFFDMDKTMTTYLKDLTKHFAEEFNENQVTTTME